MPENVSDPGHKVEAVGKVEAVTCPGCGTQNEHYRAECYHCGSLLEVVAPLELATPSKSTENWNALIIAVAVVIALIWFVTTVLPFLFLLFISLWAILTGEVAPQ